MYAGAHSCDTVLSTEVVHERMLAHVRLVEILIVMRCFVFGIVLVMVVGNSFVGCRHTGHRA